MPALRMQMRLLLSALVLSLLTAATPALAQHYHAADITSDHAIDASELLRIIQFVNADGLHCESGTEDGYAPEPGDETFEPHDIDYAPQN